MRNLIYLGVMATGACMTLAAAIVTFLAVYPVTVETITTGPFELWDHVVLDPSGFIVAFSGTMMSGIAINRLAVNLLHAEERLAGRAHASAWHRIRGFLASKDEDNGLASRNETLLKIKNAAAFLVFASMLVLAIFPLARDSTFMGILEAMATGTGWDAFTIWDYVVGLLFLAVAGGTFVAGNVATWFYLGRAFSSQAGFIIETRGARWAWMKVAAWVVSGQGVLPILAGVMGRGLLLGAAAVVVSSTLAIACTIVAIACFHQNPASIVLDPKALEWKVKAGLVEPPRARASPREASRDPVKIACLAFLVATVLGTSIILAGTWFPALASYAAFTGLHEWGFYFWSGLLVIGGPPVLLWFLSSIHARRLLGTFFIGLILVAIAELVFVLPHVAELGQLATYTLTTGTIVHATPSGVLGTSGRPFHVVSIWMLAPAAIACIAILKRRAFPFPTRDRRERGGAWSLERARAFVTVVPGRRAGVAIVGFLVVLSGMVVSFQPPASIVLEHPGTDLQLSFWYGFPDPVQNSTLELLGSAGARIHTSVSISEAHRYAAFGIELVPHLAQPTTLAQAGTIIAQVNNTINTWEANGLGHAPYIGFNMDIERNRGLGRFNETAFAEVIEATGLVAGFIASRGYRLYPTYYMMTVGDRLDGDTDLDASSFNGLDLTWTVGHYDWMVYRSEIAIEYDEPSPYVTYEWARFIRHYMLAMGGEGLLAKASMSIGWITDGDPLPLFRGDEGLDELIMDARICHAVGIPGIIVGASGSFHRKWGDEGLQEFISAVRTWDRIEVPFNRRATFFGNLKISANPTGSVFGYLYSDAWLDPWVGSSPFLVAGLFVVMTLLGFMRARKPRGQEHASMDHAAPTSSLEARALPWVRVALVAVAVVLLVMMVVVLPNYGIGEWNYVDYFVT